MVYRIPAQTYFYQKDIIGDIPVYKMLNKTCSWERNPAQVVLGYCLEKLVSRFWIRC